MSARTRLAGAVVLVGALALGGCGGGEEPQRRAEASRAGAQIRVIETEFELDPAKAQVAQAGQVRIEAVNRGQTVHALAVETRAGERSTETIEPGRSRTLTADLPPGRYTWYCPVGNHRELGMEGMLTVGGENRRPAPTPEPEPSGAGGYGY